MHPLNNEELHYYTHRGNENNRSCGDEVTLYLNIKNDNVAIATFTGSGCSLCIATASLLASKLRDLPLIEAKKLTPTDILSFTQTEKGSKRETCCLISYYALQKALTKNETVKNH